MISVFVVVIAVVIVIPPTSPTPRLSSQVASFFPMGAVGPIFAEAQSSRFGRSGSQKPPKDEWDPVGIEVATSKSSLSVSDIRNPRVLQNIKAAPTTHGDKCAGAACKGAGRRRSNKVGVASVNR